ncbi:uncharacterized protein SCHCODRAFT_02483876 [Schizophyllum commune H4-8]|uniref:DUF6593 domain-containing protein n=1 Tax=Schizophyllum commune (strain H4-8 / FGSC 9210) TaxID=578458 RepID=D8PWN7_SCHCM|nr:uncharacterized protein SCHCODRAFT_02483876 [Schizophyllum commune H4-8]KAI5899879.1 hypothetical protein SCHCODRAFT_02483876 [Schizophyllum commune H4-8]
MRAQAQPIPARQQNWTIPRAPQQAQWHNLFYTGTDDPRSCVVIGEDSKPHLYCFDTTHYGSSGLRTMLQKDNRDIVATIDWSPGDYWSGRVTIGARHLYVSQLLAPGSSSRHVSARSFLSMTGKKCEWRRSGQDNSTYDLYAGTSLIASYRRLVVTTSVGPSHGLLEYLFDHDAFLTEVIVTLCLNRWIDTHAFGTSTSFQHV